MLKRIARALLPRRVLGWIRVRRLHWAIQRYPTRVVRHNYGNGELSVYLSDGLAGGWYDHDWPDLPEIARLRQHRLRPGARVFDVGAHQGVVAMMLAREVGPTGRVVAIEPSEHNVVAARKNVELNGMTQLTVVHAAVLDTSGPVTFNQGANAQMDDGTAHWGRNEVRGVTADELAAEFGLPDVMFVDVEGCECRVLDGARTILSHRIDWFVEVHVGCGLETLGGSVDRVLAYFPSSQYDILINRADGDGFRPPVPNDPILKERFHLLAIARNLPDPS